MGGLGLSSTLYHLLPVDLRDSPERSLSTLIQSRPENTAPILQADVPTLFLAECVLVYMTLEESSAALQWFSSHFQVQFVFFDMDELRQYPRRRLRGSFTRCIPWMTPLAVL